jgi:multidrug efflux pump subunit AcrB
MEEAEKSAISKFSTFFVKRYRITFLLFVALLALGFASYNRFLTREGFPEVQVPIVVVQTPYFVNDAQKVDQEITTPIETAISDIKEINKIQSTTTENVSIIMVEFDQDFSTKEGVRQLRDEVGNDAKLPEAAKVEYRTFNAGSMDGKHDLILTISNDKNIPQLQEKAESVAKKLEKTDLVADANVIELITEQTNPVTREKFDYQSGFNRIGTKKDGVVEFDSAVAIGVVKKGDVGVIKLSDSVREEINKLKDEGDLEGYEVSYGGDFAEVVKTNIADLEENALNALLAVVIILFLFISWRASIVTAIFIPTVFGATLIGLFLIGYTLNVIVLFSLILVLGLFVDDAIVVVEAIDYQKRKGKKGIKAIASAIKDIGPADVAGTLTTVLVFLPMAFVSGLLGEFIQLIPITVILSLTLSILISLTITAFLSNILIQDIKKEKDLRGIGKIWNGIWDFVLYGFSKLVNKLGFYAGRFVYLYLKWKVLTLLMIILSILLIVGGASFAPKLTFAVFPPPKDSEDINIFLTYPPGIDIKQAEETAKDAEVILLLQAEKHIKSVNYFMASKEEAFINIKLSPLDSRSVTSREIVEDLRGEFENFGDTQVRVEQSGVGPPTDEFQINLQVFSDDQSILKSSSEDIKNFLTDKEIKDGGKVTDVLITNLDNVSKEDRRQFASVKAKVSDPNNTDMILNLQEQIKSEYGSEKLKSLGLEEDALGFDLGQEGENIESFNSAIFALMLALILMYILLVFQFESFLQPLLIFLAIPLSFPGLFPGLYLTDNSLGFFVMLGVIALAGIVVNNSIFLVDYANQNRKKGNDIKTSVAKAVQVRFRPIITTSATTIFALLPLTLANPFWESLGFTIIFGLAASSILVITVFPVYYGIVEKIRDTKSKLLKKFV